MGIVKQKDDKYIMYTDGGCYNNGDRKGDGSYGFLFIDKDNTEYVDIYCEYIENTTNNRMEMMAVIEGIKYLDEHVIDNHPQIDIVSDSGYLVKGYTDPAYLDRWISNGWKTSTKKPVQNRDMWMELQRLSWHIGFNFIHIKGHKKDKDKEHAYWNDIVDRACTYMLELQKPGFFIVLRYYFDTKEFKPVTTQLIQREKGELDNGRE